MKAKLQSELKAAMKAKDRIRLNTLRALISTLQYEEMQKNLDELPEEVATALFQTEVKKRRESLEFAIKDNRSDLKEELEFEIGIIQEFLPQQLSEAELEEVIKAISAEHPDANIGVVMKNLKALHGGKFDGKTASQVARKVLG